MMKVGAKILTFFSFQTYLCKINQAEKKLKSMRATRDFRRIKELF